jgi:hypothetical protein
MSSLPYLKFWGLLVGLPLVFVLVCNFACLLPLFASPLLLLLPVVDVALSASFLGSMAPSALFPIFHSVLLRWGALSTFFLPWALATVISFARFFFLSWRRNIRFILNFSCVSTVGVVMPPGPLFPLLPPINPPEGTSSPLHLSIRIVLISFASCIPVGAAFAG